MSFTILDAPWSFRFIAVIGGIVAVTFSLQGCTVAIPKHKVGFWEQKPNYFASNQYYPPGMENSAILNSCSSPKLAPNHALQCNGHGTCTDWFKNTKKMAAVAQTADVSDNQKEEKTGGVNIRFCKCDLYWAGPECRTQRKSQLAAFVTSLFLGMFGFDQLYLGFWLEAFLKFISFGGLGAWYLFDLVRIGSTPVPTYANFNLAADLPHGWFVVILLSAMLFVGYALSVYSVKKHHQRRTLEAMIAKLDDAACQDTTQASPFGPGHYDSGHMPQAAGRVSYPDIPFAPPGPSFHGYGSTLGAPQPPASNECWVNLPCRAAPAPRRDSIGSNSS